MWLYCNVQSKDWIEAMHKSSQRQLSFARGSCIHQVSETHDGAHHYYEYVVLQFGEVRDSRKRHAVKFNDQAHHLVIAHVHCE